MIPKTLVFGETLLCDVPWNNSGNISQIHEKYPVLYTVETLSYQWLLNRFSRPIICQIEGGNK